MARARSIKPGFYKNEELAECSVWARYIFPGLWMLADREGRLEDRPKRIKAELSPFDDKNMSALLSELEAHGFISRYKNSEGKFIQINNFLKHQSPHYSEKHSVIKPPEFPESERDDDHESLGIDPGARTIEPENPQAMKGGSQPPCLLIPSSLTPDCLTPDCPTPDSDTSPQEGRGEARRTKLPAHWRPGAEAAEFAYAEHPAWTAENLERVIADFRDHWISKGERREDWDAAWRKWVRAEAKRPNGKATKAADLYERNLAATADWKPQEPAIRNPAIAAAMEAAQQARNSPIPESVRSQFTRPATAQPSIQPEPNDEFGQ